MVFHLLHGSFDRHNMPQYQRAAGSGCYEQTAHPHFPSITGDPHEILDPTFYSRRLTTSPAMDEIISRYGGDGIVVSRHECLSRYAKLSDWFAASRRRCPVTCTRCANGRW